MRIAVYDLDRTITRRPTFTPFLLFAARRRAPSRLLLTPIWVAAMAGYRAGLYDRTRLKRFGMKLMCGAASSAELLALGHAFAQGRLANDGLWPRIREMIEEDRRNGSHVVVATAAFEFYARHFAEALGISDVIATRWSAGTIPGGNCYGPNKKARFEEWCAERAIDPQTATLRVVSDSFADAPLFAMAYEPVFVTRNKRDAIRAHLRGWEVCDPAGRSDVRPRRLPAAKPSGR